MENINKILLLLMISLNSYQILAKDTLFKKQYLENKLEVFTAFGVLNVKGQEIFNHWHNDHLNYSHIIWNTHSGPILKVGFYYHLLPQLTLGATLWANQHRENSHMFDYDWLEPENPYHRTDLSSHSNTKLKANGFDIHLKYWLTENNAATRFALLFGLKNDRYQWVAPSYGYFEYEDDGLYGFYGDSRYPIVSYKQTFKVPYLGFSMDLTQGKWLFDAIIS
ncbi:omptin family outer membrane protease [Neisseriaceae bacterium PsAf]|nr:omptin family outer membrane protease [Neisseriaceae bacterium PsAf]